MNLLTSAALTQLDELLSEIKLDSTHDSTGNTFAWGNLSQSESLLVAAESLAGVGARLCTITVYNKEKFATNSDMEIVYNFDIDGTVLTLTLALNSPERTVPSLIAYFPNADWHEREFAELYDLELSGRTAPKRLFLDPSLEQGVLNRLVPLSSMMNGASTKRLWETIFSQTSMPDWAKESK
ncbi:NADH-quinone oxidoreductase subunit C [Pseudodesulfovibrio piezophilus]|uniref:Carbon monoxide-induced hydrogenase, CooU n=1 Tax=Pseudodesulfovibrio piezophilus (strain DSM 21447 / JCM 15486 / C1TLV30) TaxID=1322246 RepID=M1WU57_PSEP2|nr:NADH-quinone oxidoreductase subunit C [Pseudodesulfovibrio piezophilus]CCH50257.1 carbon monoxide-induced hydrogenase, CooU [Pseudodesulfovibrio piezophilus C1TLV30]